MDLPQPPQDPDLKNIIDKLAQFVARNGPEFEAMTKAKQKGNPKFGFLFGGDNYHYYTYKVTTEQAIQRQRMQQQQQQQQSLNSNQYQQNEWSQHSNHDSWGSPYQRPTVQPRPLMDVNPYGEVIPHQSVSYVQPPKQNIEIEKFEEQIVDAQNQVETLKEQISQSETNLAAQKEVTETQVNQIALDTIQNAKREHLELLAADTGMNLEEMDEVMSPIIDSCTKDSISSGKGWIFTKATCHDNNQLIASYLAFRVTGDNALFSLKLHLIYLMNDVLHHCLRKGNEELKQSFESVAVEMFCSAWISSSQDSERAKLSKLVRLWEEKQIFSNSTLNKMRNAHEAWEHYKDQLRESYSNVIDLNTKPYIDTYNSYEKQHDAFVSHAKNTISNLEVQIKALEEKIAEAKEMQQLEEQKALEEPEDDEPEKASQDWGQSKRSSRWDTGEDGSYHQPQSWGEPVAQFPPSLGYEDGPPGFAPHHALPDLSRPPPGFGGPPPGLGFGPPHMPPVVFDEKQLIPTLPYYELPAGLMVPLIHLEDSGYKPVDPSKIRLPPPIPPSQSLIAALEQFYAPPSHDRPRDPDGWEMLGLYEWSRRKSAAIKSKADAIEAGTRDRSRTASPDPYQSGGSTPETRKAPAELIVKEVVPAKRKRYTSRSRSRTRSRSRESTPEFDSSRKRRDSRSPPSSRNRRQRSESRSPSPTGSYSIPSYLSKTKGSPPRSRRGNSRSPSRSPPPRRISERRSPSPEAEAGYAGFGSSKKLDSSNKGHMLMQKMGWKGSGLGQGETGIVEPISGGEVRDKSDLYRGVGAGGGGSDPFEAFRKNKAGSFYTRMKDRKNDRPRKSDPQ